MKSEARSAPLTLEERLGQFQNRVNAALAAQLPEIPESQPSLHRAMHYASTNGGKRIRPILV
ncbi:MAG: hypothetical protein AAF420_13085, partial [Pseudomonadota bacterium]